MKKMFCCPLLWTTVRLHGKKLQNATKNVLFSDVVYRLTVYKSGVIVPMVFEVILVNNGHF